MIKKTLHLQWFLLLPILVLPQILLTSQADAQPDIKYDIVNEKYCWQKGSGLAYLDIIENRFGPGYYAASGLLMSPPFGNTVDAIIYKLDMQFEPIDTWHFGGSSIDVFHELVQLDNGDIIARGETQSTDGDVSDTLRTVPCIWMAKIDTNGTLLRERKVGGRNGGTTVHEGDMMRISPDNHIYLRGSTLASDYDFAHQNYGPFDTDAFLLRMDTSFEINWIKWFTGPEDNPWPSVPAFIGDNTILYSIVSDKTDSMWAGHLAKGRSDAVLFKIDSSANDIANYRIGGGGEDGITTMWYDEQSNEVFALGGTGSHTGDGDITYNRDSDGPSSNVWFVRMDTNFNVKVSKAYGCSEHPSSCYSGVGQIFAGKKQGLYFMATNTNANSANPEHDFYNAVDTISTEKDVSYMLALDTNLNLVGSYTTQSQYHIGLWSFKMMTESKDLIWNCFTFNNTGSQGPDAYRCRDTSSAYYYTERFHLWPLTVDVPSSIEDYFKVYPNPATDFIYIENLSPQKRTPYQTQIYSPKGQLVHTQILNRDITNIPCAHWPSGLYTVSIYDKENLITKKIIKL